jgi:hypothetical protein
LMTAHTSCHPTAARRSTTPPQKGRQPGCYARRGGAEDPCTRSVHRPRRRCLATLRRTDLVEARPSSAANGRARRDLSRGSTRPRGPGLFDVECRCAVRQATDNRRGVEVLAQGRSAKVLLFGWLAGIIGMSTNSCVSTEPDMQRLAGRQLRS